MIQYNYPTTLLYGEGALEECVNRIAQLFYRNILIVTDPGILSLNIHQPLLKLLDTYGVPYELFTDTHSNPTESDVQKGTALYSIHSCDAIIAFGGGSSIDTAKAILFMATHALPLSEFQDSLGGTQKMTNPLPPLYAIPTTAGTGSEVGRCAVITLSDEKKKALFFHPDLVPKIAVLAPELTIGLPKTLSVTTGVDALVHNIEAYFAPLYHPMASAIAREGIAMVLHELPIVYNDPINYDARGKMLLASTMGATAFQKGLGMIHAMAHPISAHFNLHHGLANALLLPICVEWLETHIDDEVHIAKMNTIKNIVHIGEEGSLSSYFVEFLEQFDITLGLHRYGISETDVPQLARDAYADESRLTNMIPISVDDFETLYREAL
ncbi:MAG: iron-containing alcohol dehydrogenase [Fibrobacterales bacterium]